MSNTHSGPLSFLRMLAGGILMVGISLVVSTSTLMLAANLTGQGATTLAHPVVTHEATLESPALHSSAFIFDLQPDLRTQLFVGMLLILLGFAFYSLWIMRTRRQ